MATRLFNAPIRVPSCPFSEIWNIQGLTSEMKAPENIPYATPNVTINAAECPDDVAVDISSVDGSQSAKQLTPARIAEVKRRLNRP
jgi:hypothetical protein